jgi:hypothetical protein
MNSESTNLQFFLQNFSYFLLSGAFPVKQAQSKAVKIKIWIFPSGLEVHLEDIHVFNFLTSDGQVWVK